MHTSIPAEGDATLEDGTLGAIAPEADAVLWLTNRVGAGQVKHMASTCRSSASSSACRCSILMKGATNISF